MQLQGIAMKKRRPKADITLFYARNHKQMLEQAKSMLARPNRTDSILLQNLMNPEDSLEPLGPLAGPLSKADAGKKCCS
jgi:hypothetical protein